MQPFLNKMSHSGNAIVSGLCTMHSLYTVFKSRSAESVHLNCEYLLSHLAPEYPSLQIHFPCLTQTPLFRHGSLEQAK